MTTPNNSNKHNDKEEKEMCYSKLAREGITLMLNNKQNEAETLFKTYPESIQMNAGYAYAVFTDALMTFEDDKLQLALQTLKDLDRKCSAYTGWMRSVRTKMFGADNSSTYAEQLESQIILADTYVFVATLTFLQQDISGYFRGGWLLRKSYKHFQHTYNEILALYNQIVGDNNIPILSSKQDVLASPNMQGSLPSSGVSSPIEDMPSVPIAIASDEISEPAQTQAEIPIPDPQFPSNNREPDKNLGAVLSNSNLKPTASVQQKNGYIFSPHQPSKKPTTHPKHSISCHENMSSFTSAATTASSSRFSNGSSLKNGYIRNKCKSARSACSQFRPLLSKSASVNSALCNSSEKQPSSFGNSLSFSYFTSSFNIFTDKLNVRKDIDKETISRLLCAVSFGYGLLQLGISLLPPSMLRLTSFLGFAGNRKNGLENLMFARLGTDMRAPFATLTLLWYHTIVRPFFALDGNNVQAGVEAAAQLIEETREEYGESALFLFFRGRVERLSSDIPAAIRAFQAATENAAQREIKMMSLHEVGWCYLIQLDFSKSESTFNSLKQTSRWSRSFYSYLTIISAGSNSMFQECADARELRNVFLPVIKGTQLDEFLNRRYKICPIEEDVLKNLNCLFWKLLVYELLYLWNTLPSCTNEKISVILDDCMLAVINDCEPLAGLAELIAGSCFCILRKFEEGMDSFRNCLERRKSMPYNSDAAHISAFAQYELGLLLIKNSQTSAEGKKLLQLVAYNYKDYDFEQRLSVRVHAILKNL